MPDVVRGGEKCVYERVTPIKVKFMYCLDCLKLPKRLFSLSSTEEYLVINMDHFCIFIIIIINLMFLFFSEF